MPAAPAPLAPSPSSLSSSSPLLKHCIPSLALCWLCSTRKEGPRPPLYQDSSFSLPIPLIVNSSSSTSFPSGSVSKESVCNAGDLRSVPGWGRFPGGGHGNPLQYSCQENSIDRGAWWATVHGSQRVGPKEQLTHAHTQAFIKNMYHTHPKLKEDVLI